MEYDLEIDKVIQEIKKASAKNVVIQLPDGLKEKATEIASKLQSSTEANILIWMGSNFGACDIPLELNSLNIDLLVHFGHSKWMYD